MEIMKDQHFGPLGDARYQEYAGLAHDATAKMIGLCDRLVRTPEPDSGARPVAIRSLLADIAAMYRPMAEARGLTLDVDLQDDLPDLAINTDLLTTVLSNLLTNAIKFTPRGGRVSLLARQEPLENVAMFVVSDSGVGLDPEEIAVHMQTDGQEGRDVRTIGAHGDAGSGLGLVIARRSVADLGGTLELRSQKGVGTCAIIRLPLSAAIPNRRD